MLRARLAEPEAVALRTPGRVVERAQRRSEDREADRFALCETGRLGLFVVTVCLATAMHTLCF